MIVAGFGFRAAATVDSLADAMAQACGAHLPSLLATASDKAAAPAFCQLLARTGLPGQPIPAGLLAAITTLTQSTAARRSHNTGSVAEAAALAAAGPGAHLLGPRRISSDRMATCALAIGDST